MEGNEYDSITEFFEGMARSTEVANRWLADKQRSLTYGSDFIRFYDIQNRIIIFGHVYTEDEMFALEGGNDIEKIPDPRERQLAVDEIAYILDRMRDANRNGYLYGWCSSIIEPGEPGNTHRSACWPITRDLYDAAKAVNWNVDRLDPEERAEVEAVYQAFRSHYVTVAEQIAKGTPDGPR